MFQDQAKEEASSTFSLGFDAKLQQIITMPLEFSIFVLLWSMYLKSSHSRNLVLSIVMLEDGGTFKR